MDRKPKVLVMVDWFEPGFKAGGPIRSAVNFADQLDGVLDIHVLTTDRDLGDVVPYADVVADQWTARGGHHVFHASPGRLGWSSLRSIIRGVAPDHLYLNSMFSLPFTILPLLMRRMGALNMHVVLAPRGMLRASALAHKAGKKKMFLLACKLLGLFKGVSFHATDAQEEADVRRIFGRGTEVFLAGNLPARLKPLGELPVKEPGALRMLFVGRIHPIKNLDFLLCALQGVHGKVELTVVAPIEDQVYWSSCTSAMEKLGPNIHVRVLQHVPHAQIEEHILLNHIFALPTKGENFGHAIYEAISAGRPVLISDQTPWRGLEARKAGWDLPISDASLFRERIERMVGMGQEEYGQWCHGAWNLAHDYQDQDALRASYTNQFS